MRIIAGEAWEERGYQFIGFVASNEAYDKGLRSIRDLPGKRFGVTQLGSTFHYNVGMLTDKYGWDNKAVSVVPTAVGRQHGWRRQVWRGRCCGVAILRCQSAERGWRG